MGAPAQVPRIHQSALGYYANRPAESRRRALTPTSGSPLAEVDVRRKAHGYNEVTEKKEHPVGPGVQASASAMVIFDVHVPEIAEMASPGYV